MQPAEPIRHYEHETPGTLIASGHQETGPLPSTWPPRSRQGSWRSCGAVLAGSMFALPSTTTRGWLYETAGSAWHALIAGLRYYYPGPGVRLTLLLTDNGARYTPQAFRHTVRRLGLRHQYTRPYTPSANGEAERLSRLTFMSGPTHSATKARYSTPRT